MSTSAAAEPHLSFTFRRIHISNRQLTKDPDEWIQTQADVETDESRQTVCQTLGSDCSRLWPFSRRSLRSAITHCETVMLKLLYIFPLATPICHSCDLLQHNLTVNTVCVCL